MLTVTLDELELNAVLASLDDRVNRMSRQLATLSEQPESPDNAFAIDCTREAIRHALRAQLEIAAALPDEEQRTGCRHCGADGSYSRHWVECPDFRVAVPA